MSIKLLRVTPVMLAMFAACASPFRAEQRDSYELHFERALDEGAVRRAEQIVFGSLDLEAIARDALADVGVPPPGPKAQHSTGAGEVGRGLAMSDCNFDWGTPSGEWATVSLTLLAYPPEDGGSTLRMDLMVLCDCVSTEASRRFAARFQERMEQTIRDQVLPTLEMRDLRATIAKCASGK
jgi:hypothetical protein